jgi:hypothetical protein
MNEIHPISHIAFSLIILFRIHIKASDPWEVARQMMLLMAMTM